MPRPRHALEEQVYVLIAENPGAGPDTLRRLMERQARQQLARAGRSEVDIAEALKLLPPPATIGRMKRRFLNEKSEQERAEYRYVRWPESFDAGLLPWEAAREVLDLMHAWGGSPRRPTVRLARWAWRLALAAPDAPQDRRWEAAEALTEADVLGVERRDIEAWLAFAPWRGGRDRDAYARVIKGRFPFAGEPIREYLPGQGLLPRDLTPEQALQAAMASGRHDEENAGARARWYMMRVRQALEAEGQAREEDGDGE